MFAINTRRVAISLLTLSSLFSASAFASKPDCSMKAYAAENLSRGDGSPTPFSIWSIEKGCVKGAAKAPEFTAKDVEYLQYANSVGDASSMSFNEFHFPSKPSAAPKVITAEERQYMNFANVYGDATPPSLAEWKAMNSSTLAAQPGGQVADAPKDNWDINVKLMHDKQEQGVN